MRQDVCCENEVKDPRDIVDRDNAGEKRCRGDFLERRSCEVLERGEHQQSNLEPQVPAEDLIVPAICFYL